MTPKLSPHPASTPTGRILVVDNDEALRRFVHHLLTRDGHHVAVAAGVTEAVGLLSRAEYDVALVDLDMPERTGLELLDEIRGAKLDVVSVLLTGTTDVAAAVGGMKRGAFDYLAKPADPVAIRWTVARALGVVRTRRRAVVLESALAEWRATFDACPDLMLVLDPDGRVVRANQAVLRRTWLAADDLAGRSAGEVFAGTLGEAIRGAVDRVRAGEDVPTLKVADPASGQHLLVSVSPLPAAAGPTPGVVVIARDVSELARAKRLQARLYQQLLSAQEDERGRIARELHDGIAQSVSALAIGLGVVADVGSPAGLARLRDLGRTAADALVDIRRLVQGLHPPVLDDLGLEAALGRLTDTFTRAHGVRAELVVAAAPADRLRRGLEAAVYRITQEALTNVAKHAGAKTVDVTLDVTDRHVHLSITDDGCGFTAADRDRDRADGGLGLTSMAERAERFGGRCRIDSRPHAGTTVTVEIPL